MKAIHQNWAACILDGEGEKLPQLAYCILIGGQGQGKKITDEHGLGLLYTHRSKYLCYRQTRRATCT